MERGRRLAVLLHCFEVRDASVIQGGAFEGENVLVCKGRELRFVGYVQPPFNATSGSRVEVVEAWLEEAGWLTFTHTANRIEVRLGPRARALRQGRPS